MTETIFIDPLRFRASAGKFNSEHRYLRAGSTLSTFPLVKGFTIDIIPNQGPFARVSVYRFNVAGYTAETTNSEGLAYATFGSFAADFTDVTT